MLQTNLNLDQKKPHPLIR